MADKCNTTEQPEWIRAHFRNVRKRLAWPYKEETLVDLQAVLSRFQANLSLALQNAGLDAVLILVGGLKPVLDNIQGQSTDIASNLNRQAGILGTVHQDLAELMHVQQQDSSAILRELSELHTQMSGYEASVTCSMGVLVSTVGN
jgi:hypothetical protein